MINEALWFLLMFVNFAGIVLAYRLFGRMGLFAWVAMAIILANIQVAKLIRFFGFVTAMGNIIYGTTFLATDILTEKYGKKEARKAVFIGFFVLISMTVIMQLTLMFIPAEEDTLSPALEQIFGFMPDVMVEPLSISYLAASRRVGLRVLEEEDRGQASLAQKQCLNHGLSAHRQFRLYNSLLCGAESRVPAELGIERHIRDLCNFICDEVHCCGI